MNSAPNPKSQRAFISAGPGIALGFLPEALSQRHISWEWAKDSITDAAADQYAAIKNADAFIAVISGFRSDYRVLFELGIAAALEKRILVISSPKRKLPVDLSRFSQANLDLEDRFAIDFHLDAFFSRSSPSIFDRGPVTSSKSGVKLREISLSTERPFFESEIERRVADIITANGGSVVAQPNSPEFRSYRPDLLMWIDLEGDGLPEGVVIEVRTHADPRSIRPIEDRLIGFMNTTGLRLGLVITQEAVPDRTQPLWPTVFWLELNEFKNLMSEGSLGTYLRSARNRAVHGVR